MKVIAYNNICKLNKCINLIGVYKNNCILFIKNGLSHNAKFYAYININYSTKEFAYEDIWYEDYNNVKSWKKFIKNKIRAEKLKIFQ